MDHLKSLFEKYKNNKSSQEEIEELLDAFAEDKSANVMTEYIARSLDEDFVDVPDLDHSVNEVYQNLNKNIFERRNRRIIGSGTKSWKWYSVAASITLVITLGYLLVPKIYNKTKELSAYANDVSPMKKGVTLTLANGEKVNLNNAGIGELTKESGVSISKTADGKLIYAVNSNNEIPATINILTTGKGEVFQVQLPDGSLVWLNALSSLTYATGFQEDGVRKVKLEGEAYFQVAKDNLHPFIVTSLGQQVRVLGTHFNINSYPEEGQVKTTLLEGSVKVSSQSTSAVSTTLKPGQQSVLIGNDLHVRSVDTLDVLGWKKGDFIFKEQKLESIMRDVARWYDVKVVYETDYPRDVILGGLVSRSKNISAVLRLFEATGKVHFKLKDDTVTVTK